MSMLQSLPEWLPRCKALHIGLVESLEESAPGGALREPAADGFSREVAEHRGTALARALPRRRYESRSAWQAPVAAALPLYAASAICLGGLTRMARAAALARPRQTFIGQLSWCAGQ